MANPTITIDEVITRIGKMSPVPQLPKPSFKLTDNQSKVVLGVESMREHMTDEGFQITRGLALNGYNECGHNLFHSIVDVRKIIDEFKPGTLVIQDIREWDVSPTCFRDRDARFIRVPEMKKHDNIFRLTILKDSQQRPEYHRTASDEMGCHAWIVYYNPRIVSRLARYTRPEHLIRTYHSLDPSCVPEFTKRKAGCLISGAVSGAYPLRSRIIRSIERLPVDVLSHPGYHRSGCATPGFLKLLTEYKVHICTASRFGYSLRKLIESTAAGCRVITDLPIDEVMPEIDENFIRIHPDISISDLDQVVTEAILSYNPERQEHLSKKAVDFYDFVKVTRRLSEDIEKLRQSY